MSDQLSEHRLTKIRTDFRTGDAPDLRGHIEDLLSYLDWMTREFRECQDREAASSTRIARLIEELDATRHDVVALRQRIQVLQSAMGRAQGTLASALSNLPKL